MNFIIFTFSLLLSLSSFAFEKASVKGPDKMIIEGKELVLNGAGVRRATIFNIKVYVGALYLPEKTKETNKLLDLPHPKHISMDFIRDVDAEDLQGAWKEGFEAAVEEAKRKTMMTYLDQFNKQMGDIRKGQKVLINFLDSGVEVTFNGKKSAKIGNKDFSRALLSIWFVNARDEELRDEMLGKI